jgi:hypothetical protein
LLHDNQYGPDVGGHCDNGIEITDLFGGKPRPSKKHPLKKVAVKVPPSKAAKKSAPAKKSAAKKNNPPPGTGG